MPTITDVISDIDDLKSRMFKLETSKDSTKGSSKLSPVRPTEEQIVVLQEAHAMLIPGGPPDVKTWWLTAKRVDENFHPHPEDRVFKRKSPDNNALKLLAAELGLRIKVRWRSKDKE
jgi:hypothetical protein